MTGRHRLRSVLTLTYLNGILPIRRQPLYMVNLLASPFSFLFFIAIASRGTLLLYGIAGGMLLTMLSVGTSLQTDITHFKQDLKLQDQIVASPIEAWVYVFGLALSELVYSLPGMVAFVILWVVHGGVTLVGAATLSGVLILVWAFSSTLGFTLATYFEDIRETFAFSPLISLGLSVLPPVYYPITLLPAAVRPLAYIVPTTEAADLVHFAFGLSAPTWTSAVFDWGVLVAFTVALFALAVAKARWREP